MSRAKAPMRRLSLEPVEPRMMLSAVLSAIEDNLSICGSLGCAGVHDSGASTANMVVMTADAGSAENLRVEWNGGLDGIDLSALDRVSPIGDVTITEANTDGTLADLDVGITATSPLIANSTERRESDDVGYTVLSPTAEFVSPDASGGFVLNDFDSTATPTRYFEGSLTRRTSKSELSLEPLVRRIGKDELPATGEDDPLVDVTSVADVAAVVDQGPYPTDTAWTPRVAEVGLPIDSDRTSEGLENAPPRMTVDGVRGHGQLFELAMATGDKPVAATSTTDSTMLGELSSIRLDGVAFDSADVTESAFVPIRIASGPTTVSPRTFSPATADEAESFDVALARADRHRDVVLMLQGQPTAAADEVAPMLDDAAVEVVLSAKDTPVPATTARDAVFAGLAHQGEDTDSSPIRLDERRHDVAAAVLVAVVATGRLRRPSEDETARPGTCLKPHRRPS